MPVTRLSAPSAVQGPVVRSAARFWAGPQSPFGVSPPEGAGLTREAITRPAAAKPTTCSIICARVKAEGKPYQFQSGTFTAIPALNPIAVTNKTRLAKDLSEPKVRQTSIGA